jgi:hypothetical protein
MVPTLLFAVALLGPQAQAPKTPPEPLKLTGCLSTQLNPTGDYTFTSEQGVQYRLTGKDSRKYAGKKIEITQADIKGLRIKGGLYPTPNIAAQAGAIDPVQAGIATQPGGGAVGVGTNLPPEFHASRVRAVEGSCQ